jgi:general secretion pathway protein D
VLSGKTAEIVVAQEFRYPEMYGDMAAEVGRGDSTAGSAGVAITAGTPRDFAVRNIGVEMRVTPTVEQDRAISLRLEPVVTELEGFVEYGGTSVAIASDTTVTVPSGFYQPVFSVRRVRTEVTIWDGATVVMGGLTREQAVKIRDKVPILGDIPLLGRLFRSEGESVQKRNLLIFVTASLVGPGGARTDYDDHPSSH